MKRTPIRLGGVSARDGCTDVVLSLEAVGDQPATVRSAIPVAEWRALLAAVGFNQQEIRYLILNKLDRVPRRALPALTGWSAAEVERLRVATQDRLRYLRGKSPTLDDYRKLTAGYGSVYWESLPCGRVLSMRMSVSDPFSTQTINGENVSSGFSKSPFLDSMSIRPPLAQGIVMELEKRLTAAELVSGRIWGQKERADQELAAAEHGLAIARQELARDEEDALLADRKPSAKLAKQMSDAETAVQEAKHRADVAERAYIRAFAEIDAIKGEIDASRFHRFRTVIDAGPGPRLRAALEEFVAASIEAEGLMRKHGMQYRGDVLFPGETGDFVSDGVSRNRRISLMNEALRLASTEIRSGRRQVA